ncbi:metal ABC transporter substrate-binding protein [Caproiciproducens sp. NJN-50]|uniref:MetQ/NlpA family ABC transporter substrate-binding protein n=1 Tax=Caproiciproducens sp. NJN-50 TaxID=2507162 RepID=UPI000FFDFDFA|nr:MetQ/NlpA family ABC transporter substrate-binding protein [Caproiciproducens sp. NJN-50]QAT50214.1 metal ABC transporter substrate-binding protein [Caproiciproducens sp. NJN-50]
MKKVSAALSLLVLLSVAFTGCAAPGENTAASPSSAGQANSAASDQSASSSGKTVLKYGKSQGPYTILFEEAIKPILEKEGYQLKAVEFSDLLQNDTALNNGEIDFNVEQHTAYAENFNKAYKGDLTPISPIPTVPAGIFSSKHKSLNEIKKGAVVAVPNDASNTARAYVLLQKAGWITLNKSVDLSKVKQSDIAENKYNLSFVEMDSLNIPRSLDDFDYAVITGSIVYNAKIDPSTALLQEDILDHLILQVVVKAENKDAKWAKDLVAAYRSDELKAYMSKNNKGLWFIPKELQ